MREISALMFDKPAERGQTESMATNLNDLIRDAVRQSGRSCRSLAEASGLDVAQLSRFMRSMVGLNLTSAGLLLDALGLDVRLVRRGKSRKGR